MMRILGDKVDLAGLIADCEQVLITAAVGADVPESSSKSSASFSVMAPPSSSASMIVTARR